MSKEIYKDEYFVGIDVGGTTAKIGLVNKDGDIVEKCQVQTLKIPDWKEIIDNYAKPVLEWLKNGYKIKGVGMGTRFCK